MNPESRRARVIDLRGINRRGLCAERLRLAARCTTLRTGRRGDGIAKRPSRRDARLGLAGSGVHLQPRCDGSARSERQERPARDLARRAREGKPPTGGGSNVLCPLGPRVADRQPASTRETRVICTPAEGAKAIVDRRSPALCESASRGGAPGGLGSWSFLREPASTRDRRGGACGYPVGELVLGSRGADGQAVCRRLIVRAQRHCCQPLRWPTVC